MKREIKILVTDKSQLTEKVICFFKQFGFKLTDHKDNILKFKTKSSLLDTWTTNPLKWGSEIFISIVDNKVLAHFCVETEAQMKTKEEESVWQTLINNFENYLISGKNSNEELFLQISENKISRPIYLGWILWGALTGGLLSFLIIKLTGINSMISVFIIPLFATYFLNWRINYVKTKNAL